MSQPQTLTTAELQAYSDQLANGTVADAEHVYADLYSKGYNYAGWAGGVASESSIAGVSAVNFLTGTAMMGWGGEQCRNLPEATLDSIRMQMATGYVDALIRNAGDSGGILKEDLNYRDTKQLHQDVFTNHNLSLDNWTLNTPMELVHQTQGEAAVEALWREIRETGGDGLDGTLASIKLYQTVGRLTFSDDPAIREAALNWIDQVPGFANWEAIGRSVDTLMEWLANTEAGRFLMANQGLMAALPFLLAGQLFPAFLAAAAVRPPVRYFDPLAIDLDGDGIETLGIATTSQAITFDHNADSVRTGTGWLKADDAWLVFDRNANGAVDSGRELFGVDFVKSNNQFATSGLDALRDLDRNLDGVFNASDAAFTQVQLWQDLNQDGISQADELFSLADKGIASINLTATATNSALGNGNTLASTAVVTRTDGSTTKAADLFVAHNPFFRSFTTEVALSDAALALPEMGGAGWVRDLREAMSLSEQQAAQQGTGWLSPSLQDQLAQSGRPLIEVVQAFAAATTKAEQMAVLDELIRAWAATNEFVRLKPVDDPLRRFVVANDPAMSARMQAIIPVLEIFNGLGVAQAGFQAPVLSHLGMAEGGTQQVMTYTLFAEQVQPMLNAYEQLRQSVYGALVMQTRLKPYLDAVGLVIEETGIRFDTSGIDALLLQRAGTDALNAVTDVLDLRRYGSETLDGLGWRFEQALSDTLEAVGTTPEITALLAAEKVVGLAAGVTAHTVTAAQAGFIVVGNSLNNTLTGSAASSDKLYGGKGNDTLIAVGNSDTLEGGAGDDVLTANGNLGTTHIGGAGNDTITGSIYADTYRFNRGDGADVITDNRGTSYVNTDYYSVTDRLIFGEGITAADIGARRTGNDLMVSVAGQAGDQITLKNWFIDSGTHHIEQLQFADGSTWAASQLTQLALATTNLGTDGNDVMSGASYYSERLVGGAGNDTLYATGNSDTLEGGAGDDVLTANGNLGTTHIGGAGNDTITGSIYADTYRFNRGDGADVITDNRGTSYVNTDYYSVTDRLVFGEGITAADIGARRTGNDLLVSIAGQAGDQITLKNWFVDSGTHHLEQLQFADGSSWTANQLTQLALTTTNLGTDGNDVMSGASYYSERLVGGAGNDTLYATGNSDTLDGGAGDDVLTANGNLGTTHIGGAGNDTITGSIYADTYRFNRGDGADVITDNRGTSYVNTDYYSVTDRLIFGEGITAADIGARRTGNDLLVNIAGQAGDQITLKNWFIDSGTHHLEQLQFADGSTWAASQLTQLALTTTNLGTDGNDVMSGASYYSERLVGGAGNDTLYATGNSDTLDGGAGDDVLTANGNLGTTHIGGAGNDTITGSIYADTYRFNRGDGADVITDNRGTSYVNTDYYSVTDRLVFGEGITAADIGARRTGNDLLVSIAGQAGDQITLKNWFVDSGTHHLEQLQFADGSSWTANQLTQLALTTTNQGTDGNDTMSGTVYYSDRLVGAGGNDTLYATGNSDTLDGGAGDDVLTANGNLGTTHIGGAGNDTITGSIYADTYRFNRGDGADVITDNRGTSYVNTDYYSVTDRLVFGEGISVQDLWFSRSGNNLQVQVLGDGGQIQVNNWYSGPEHRLETIQLSNGSALAAAQLDVLVQAMASVAPPSAGQISLTTDQQTALAPVFAAVWK